MRRVPDLGLAWSIFLPDWTLGRLGRTTVTQMLLVR